VRGLILISAVILLLAIVGWVSFSSGPGRSSINLETDEIRHDTQEVLQTGSEALRDAEQAVASEQGADSAQ
jgi:hypothetical protein